MKITVGKFLIFWLTVSFSKAMWGSWYFLMLYFLIFLSNALQNETTLYKWPLQVVFLVGVALFFGLLGTIIAVIRYKRDILEEL